MVNASWLTAMLTATGTNAPKSFPKSPSVLLAKTVPQKPMNPRQWEAMIKLLTGGNREKPTKPKYPPREP
jgi:hypothetical protein